PYPLTMENTHNMDTDLDQNFLWVLFHHNGDDYAVIRTHNGCDIRGGHSEPRVFKVVDADYFTDWHIDFYCSKCQNKSDEIEIEVEVVDEEKQEFNVKHKGCGGEVRWSSVFEGF